MNRKARLQSARHWLPSFKGKNVVRSYRKRYAVDLECALIELEKLGVPLDPAHVERLRASEAARVEDRRRRAEQRRSQQDQRLDLSEEPDSVFAYIAGYTAGGFPFGVTWEELEESVPLAARGSEEESRDV